MKYIILIISMILAIPNISKSQTYIYKEGKSKKIKTFRFVKNDSIELKSRIGNTYKYKSDEIDSIVYKDKNWMNVKSPDNEFKWFLGIDGAGCYKGGYAGMNASFGKQFNPYFYFGAGFGMKIGSYKASYKLKPDKKYFTYDSEGNLVNSPIKISESDEINNNLFGIIGFVDFRINYLKDKKLMPFTDLRAGVNISDEVGPDINCQFGIRLAFKKISRAFNISAGFNTQKVGIIDNYDYKYACFFCSRIGLEF